MLFVSPDRLMMMNIILFRSMSVKNFLGWMLDKDKLKDGCCPKSLEARLSQARVVVVAHRSSTRINEEPFF